MKLDYSRLRAWLAMHDVGFSEFARRLGYSDTHVRQIVKGERTLTREVASAIERELGSAGWTWATGRSNDILGGRS